jgi:hypothetical protein
MVSRILKIIFLVLLIIPSLVNGQETKDIDKVDIYTKYKPSLIDARRVETQPELKEPEVKELKLDYSFPDLRYKVQPAFTPITAQSYRNKPNSFINGNFIKAGFGNYTTPLLHVELHNGKNKNYSHGLSLYHLSSNGPSKYKQRSFMDDRIQLQGARFINGTTLSAQIGYSRFAYNYYGYNQNENTFKRDSIKQALNNVTGNVHFDNLKTSRKLKAQFDFDVYRFSTVQQNELGYRISNTIGGKVANGELNLATAYEGMTSGPDSVSYFRHFVDIHPYYKMKYKNVDLTIGASSTIFIDTVGSDFYLYPEFKVDYYVVPEKMKAFVGIGGSLGKGSTRTLYNENQFLAENQILKNQNTSYKIYGGVKGKLNKSFDYTLELSQQFTHNLPLYASDTFELHKFLILYDDVNIFKFQAGLNYTKFDKLNIGTFFTYYAYNGDAAEAYQRPDFEWNTRISGTIKEKLSLHGKFYVIGSRYALKIGSGDIEKLKPIIDLNIGADYRYKKDLSFFVELNNLTNQTYQRWFNYPVYGLNGVAGVTFSF